MAPHYAMFTVFKVTSFYQNCSSIWFRDELHFSRASWMSWQIQIPRFCLCTLNSCCVW